MSNQGDLQAAVRALTGTTLDYNGDWMALFDLDGVPDGTFNERLLTFINRTLGDNYQDINDAMAAYATAAGFDGWVSLTNLGPYRALLLGNGSPYLLGDGTPILLGS